MPACSPRRLPASTSCIRWLAPSPPIRPLPSLTYGLELRATAPPGQFRKLDALAVLTGPLLPAPPRMRLCALAGARSVVATTGTIPEPRMAGLGPRAGVCGWPAHDVRAVRLIRWVPLVFADEQAAVA
jgi:hypothetical protein